MLCSIRRLCVPAVAVAGVLLASGLALRATADEPKNPDAKKEQKKQPNPLALPDLDKLLPPGLDPQQADALRKQLEMVRKQLEDLQKQFPGGLPGFPGGLPGMPGKGGFPGFPGGFPFPDGRGVTSANRLGATLQRPSRALVDQLDLPKDQGMVLTEVKANSAAAKAGLKSSDILLELGGKPVPSNARDFLKALNAIKTDDAVDAVVLRKAKKETVKGLKLPDVPKAPFPGLPGGFPGGLPNLPRIQPGQLQLQLQLPPAHPGIERKE